MSGGKAQRLELPGTRLDAVIQAPDGRAWIVQGSTVSRRTDQGWERLPVPKGRPIVEIAGLEHDTPWLLRKGGALSMQTADGAWHEVAVPPVSELERAPTIDRVRVVAPGGAWVRARHAGKRGAKQTMRALYTTRDAPVPLECGREADASVGT